MKIFVCSYINLNGLKKAVIVAKNEDQALNAFQICFGKDDWNNWEIDKSNAKADLLGDLNPDLKIDRDVIIAKDYSI